MSNSDRFESFLDKQNSKQQDEKGSIVENKKEWLKHLENLYRNIEKWLKPYIDNKKLQLSYESIEIYEELSGKYKAKRGIIQFSDLQIKIEPIGTFIIGARGRVDIIGPHGKVTLLIVDKTATEPTILIKSWIRGQEPPPDPKLKPFEPAWKIATPGASRKYFELNSETFLNAIMEIAGA